MDRLSLIKNQLSSKDKAKKIIKSGYDYFDFDQFLNKEERTYRLKLRDYLEKNVKNQIVKFNEMAEFPYKLVQDLVKNFPGIFAPTMNQKYGGANLSHNMGAVIGIEIARIDMSLAAFWAVHGGEVVMKAILLLGSEEQKKMYLEKLNKLELIGAFCLTEREYGSNAYGIECSAVEDSEGNYTINGTKRWIGQGTMADIYIVWARESKSNEIQGFIVEKTRNGVSSKKIENKLAFRSVQNGEVYFENVKIPKSNKLLHANNFTGVSDVFLGSRIGVGYAVAGMCIGAYDRVIEHITTRTQFGKPLSSFQLIQEKLARVMGNIQAILFFTKRISDLHAQGKASMGMAGLCKSWCTSKGRETLQIAREMLGGNGILNENFIMRALSDIEGLHTAEGTYEINTLLVGKELTGKLAIF